MKITLDCIPCFVRQALEVARATATDPRAQERTVRQALEELLRLDYDRSPPWIGQRVHRRLRAITGEADPYRDAKDRFNRLILQVLPELQARVDRSDHPLELAVRLAIAGNTIDLGAHGGLDEHAALQAIEGAMSEPFDGDLDGFRAALEKARNILYLADNAGEIVLDRLLIVQLLVAQPPGRRVTLAVRGAPVINDVTLEDARAAGLHELVEVIDNGSDAPGTLLEDCSPGFRRRFREADLIIAKGQGNFETLSEEPVGIFFLLKVKCPVIALNLGLPVGTHVLRHRGDSLP